jgi:hypothetical protein
MATELLEEYSLEESEGKDLRFFAKDINVLVEHYIQRFFLDKLTMDGEPVSLEAMLKPSYVEAVPNLDICGGIDYIYSAVGVAYSKEEMRAFESKGHLPDDVQYVVGLYQQCAKMGIPKCFATGIIIMYLELCKGHRILK